MICDHGISSNFSDRRFQITETDPPFQILAPGVSPLSSRVPPGILYRVKSGDVNWEAMFSDDSSEIIPSVFTLLLTTRHTLILRTRPSVGIAYFQSLNINQRAYKVVCPNERLSVVYLNVFIG